MFRYEIRMSYKIIQKYLCMASYKGLQNASWSLLPFEDKLKYSQEYIYLPRSSFERKCVDRNKWRTECYKGMIEFENHTLIVEENSERILKEDLMYLRCCSTQLSHELIVSLFCKILAGLKSHIRHKHINSLFIIVQLYGRNYHIYYSDQTLLTNANIGKWEQMTRFKLSSLWRLLNSERYFLWRMSLNKMIDSMEFLKKANNKND